MSDFPIQVEGLFSAPRAPKSPRRPGRSAPEAAQSASQRGGQSVDEGSGEGGAGQATYTFEVSADWWKSREAEGTTGDGLVETPFCFNVVASAQGEAVEVAGDFTGSVSLECSRCAKRYSHALREPFKLVLESAKSMGRDGASSEGIDPEGEQALAEHGLCLGEDLEAGWFKGPVIGLDDFLGEVIALAMPLQPLCDESCAGVCPHCGVERGVERGNTDSATPSCDCEDEKIESPFAVLAALKTSKD
ncbi:MAG: DUF177 domain-containing protein [Myxococcota bacterium]